MKQSSFGTHVDANAPRIRISEKAAQTIQNNEVRQACQQGRRREAKKVRRMTITVEGALETSCRGLQFA
ncbi:MAG: hypothetical protein RLO15_12790 [Parvibaculum sp.]